MTFLAASAPRSISRRADKFGDITKRVIRDMTGNKDYEFGDGTKALSSAARDSAEAAAESVIAAGGTAAEAGAAARKAIDDSGCAGQAIERVMAKVERDHD